MQFFNQLASSYALLTSAVNSTLASPSQPPAPGLNFLYTAIADCGAGLYTTHTPKGLRTPIPIVGGNFTGPRLNGKIMNLGADWGLTDPQTGIFAPDTRYQLQTNDGANIFVQTSGAMQPDETAHLRVVFETGDKSYYWLNNIIAVAILKIIKTYEDGSIALKIDVWNLGNEWTDTKFLNEGSK